ncbi:uncharacterized protein LOC134455316 [Engraulis encrasicolus]|uniref:uncharacterized protein LOC134455316 n=1 Tax=Engraulis encrasicolus TaxID=184585 RepID=UPI002FD1B7F7
MDNPKRRALNFKHDEVEALVTLVEESKDILFGKFSATLTKEMKDKEWQRIANTVTAVAGIYRDVDSVKKKITTLTSQIKMKAAMANKEQRKTGGGTSSAPVLTPAETRVLGLVKPVSYEGVHGGSEVGLPVPDVDLETIELDFGNTEVVLQLEVQPSPKKKKRQQTDTQALIEIEREKLELYRQHLELQKERLALEREKFEWERRKFSKEIEVTL